ncbi:MAG: DUF3108 domain-containing protein [Elusimicrobia bacterium]|nr:DUF3108 domain-containing protein [Elusimicrobiota bacterium]
MKTFFFASFIFFVAPIPKLSAQDSAHPASVPWAAGEKLTYDIQWGFITAGQATLEVEGVQELQISTTDPQHKVPVYHIVATAHSNAFIDAFYKVRDKNESWMDTREWISHRFEQHNQEGKYILDQTVEFDWKNKRFRNLELVKGREPKREEGDLTIPAVDTLSSLYVTRARTFQVGEDFTLEVHSGRNWPLVVKVLKRETVKVPAGKFDCFLVEPFIRERGLFIQKGKKLKVWLTADEKKIPVKMRAEVFIGHVSAELTEMKTVH